MQNKKIYILLQEYKGTMGEFYKWTHGGSYNHSSIGISESMDEFYSFRSKWGLCVEHPFEFSKQHKKEVLCLIYELEVHPTIFDEVKNNIQAFFNEKDHYYYSYISVFMSFLGIRHSFKRGYFCSRFVAEILDKAKALNLTKDTSLYLPSDFHLLPLKKIFEGKASDFNCNVVM